MAYPVKKMPDPEGIALLFDDEKLNTLVELFPGRDAEIERLRLHYIDVTDLVRSI